MNSAEMLVVSRNTNAPKILPLSFLKTQDVLKLFCRFKDISLKNKEGEAIVVIPNEAWAFTANLKTSGKSDKRIGITVNASIFIWFF